jgi:hypothetical protein
MSDAPALSSLSRTELVMLGCLAGPESLTDDEIFAGLRELALPDSSHEQAQEAATATLLGLRGRGLVEARSKKLTGEGARALRSAFGLSRRPSWTVFRQRYFPAFVLGVKSAPDPKGKGAKVPAAVVKVLAGPLGVAGASSLNELCDSLIARLLGGGNEKMTLARIRALALAHCAGVPADGVAADVAARIVARSQSPSSEARATTPAPHAASPVLTPQHSPSARVPDGSRTAVAGPSSIAGEGNAYAPDKAAGAEDPPKPGEDLLAVVRETLPEIGQEGRFGSEKVFVSALWHKIEDRGRPAAPSLDHFKRWLVTANRNRWLTLARADVVGVMDPRQVRESEILDLGATFHFVLDPARNPAAPQGTSHVR